MVAMKSEFVVAQCGVTGCWGILWVREGLFGGFTDNDKAQVEFIQSLFEKGVLDKQRFTWLPSFACDIDITKYLDPLDGPQRYSMRKVKDDYYIVDHTLCEVAPLSHEIVAKQFTYYFNAGWRDRELMVWVKPAVVGLTWSDFHGDERGGDPSPRINYTPSDN